MGTSMFLGTGLKVTNGPFACDVTHELLFLGGGGGGGQLLKWHNAFPLKNFYYHTFNFCCISRWSSVRDLYAAKHCGSC